MKRIFALGILVILVAAPSISMGSPPLVMQAKPTVASESTVPVYTEIRHHGYRHHYYGRHHYRHHHYYPRYYYYPYYHGGYYQYNYHYPYYRGTPYGVYIYR